MYWLCSPTYILRVYPAAVPKLLAFPGPNRPFRREEMRSWKSPWHVFQILVSNIPPLGASLVAQLVKNLPAMPKTWVQSLGQEDPLEKEMGTHPSNLACEIPWTKKPGGLQSRGSQRIRHDLATKPPYHLYSFFPNKWII